MDSGHLRVISFLIRFFNVQVYGEGGGGEREIYPSITDVRIDSISILEKSYVPIISTRGQSFSTLFSGEKGIPVFLCGIVQIHFPSTKVSFFFQFFRSFGCVWFLSHCSFPSWILGMSLGYYYGTSCCFFTAVWSGCVSINVRLVWYKIWFTFCYVWLQVK